MQDLHEVAAAEKRAALEKFEKAEKNIIYKKYKDDTRSLTDADKAAAYSQTPARGGGMNSGSSTPLRVASTSGGGAPSIQGGSGGVSTKGALPSFWIPSLCPQAEKTKVVKPDKTIYCPMSGTIR